jgi:hypothetical protein
MEHLYELLDKVYNKHLDLDALVNQKLKSGVCDLNQIEDSLNHILEVLNNEFNRINNGTVSEPNKESTD